jgi:hypothetical protein
MGAVTLMIGRARRETAVLCNWDKARLLLSHVVHGR